MEKKNKDVTGVIPGVEGVEKRKKKVKKSSVVIAVIVVILVFLGVIAAHFVLRYTKDLDIDDGIDDVTGQYSDDFLFRDEDNSQNAADMIAMQQNDNLNDLLADWYTNGGEHLTSKHVMNVLLIGLDTFDGVGSGNSDVMMIVSINNETKKITLCSLFRDSYTYFDTAYGPRTSKINAAYGNGGPKYLVDAVENNYKIKIDYYAAVDFTAFEQVIDEVGGVNLDVTQNEADGIYEYANISVPVGENVLLNGEQALYFSRMRKIYTSGDIQRTENQRKVITALINKSKNLTLSQLDGVVKTLCSYVRTDCSVSKIITLGTTAILNKWYDFEIVSMEAPAEDARQPYTTHGDSVWIWVVDYPLAAQEVQNALYGHTNIILDENRVKAFDVKSTR